MSALSPMMQQYFAFKNKHKNHILFFRVGDFYEMFFDDAILCSKELELTLTGKDCGQKERAPMCGVPAHAYEGYVAKLVSKGFKVAICDQVEDPAKASGLVRREVIRVVTPGTIIETDILKEDKNNYICCLFFDEIFKRAELCFADTSTGELFITDLWGENLEYKIVNELSRFEPKEFLINVEVKDLGYVMTFLQERLMCTADVLGAGKFDEQKAKKIISEHFEEQNLENLGIKSITEGARALGALLSYLYENQKNGLKRLSDINFYQESQFMNLDSNSQRNLDLLENSQTKAKRGSLLGVLDKTRTAMGKRLLRKCLARPLVNLAVINKRLNGVEELVNDSERLFCLSEHLSCVFDIERVLTKIVFGSVTPRELRSFEFALRGFPFIKADLKGAESAALKGIFEKFDVLKDVQTLIDIVLSEEVPANVKDLGVIKDGHNSEVDSLRDVLKNSKKYIAKIEQSERERTGIKTLKIGYNRVFGYFIEVSHLNSKLVPEDYIRKQTLANCERYITKELKELEDKITTAHDKLLVLEAEIFANLVKAVAKQTDRIQKAADLIANLDLLCSFASVSIANRYVKPVVDRLGKIEIKDGRHPVVEAALANSGFVANDCFLDCDKNQVAIITGPNMAGKSTYMKQIALIVLMAQVGCFVPASYAHIGLVDGIYTRIGASDDIMSGQSTFMVEMSEVAYILNNATSQSLIILDEVGRGTSTYDGMSIARAILEYILDKDICGAKTLFATHYHEITDIEADFDSVSNYNIAVKKRENDIVFLKRIVKGAANKSYGIEVSRLSKLPKKVIDRAFEILHELEVKHKAVHKDIVGAELTEEEEKIAPNIVEFVQKLDVNVLTPIEAMNELIKLKNLCLDIQKTINKEEVNNNEGY